MQVEKLRQLFPNGPLASAATFTVGAAAPLVLVLMSPANLLLPVVAVGSLLFLALLGMIGAKAGGAGILRPTIRVMFGARSPWR
jgi:VIT1/CCC1 family predicted Fe2+/Mn2+ transporter